MIYGRKFHKISWQGDIFYAPLFPLSKTEFLCAATDRKNVVLVQTLFHSILFIISYFFAFVKQMKGFLE